LWAGGHYPAPQSEPGLARPSAEAHAFRSCCVCWACQLLHAPRLACGPSVRARACPSLPLRPNPQAPACVHHARACACSVHRSASRTSGPCWSHSCKARVASAQPTCSGSLRWGRRARTSWRPPRRPRSRHGGKGQRWRRPLTPSRRASASQVCLLASQAVTDCVCINKGEGGMVPQRV